MSKTVKTIAIASIAGLSITTGSLALATTKGQHGPKVEFYKVTQDYGTNGIQRFIIKGEKCLKTEDATKLRLVSYNPSHHKIVYRCVQP